MIPCSNVTKEKKVNKYNKLNAWYLLHISSLFLPRVKMTQWCRASKICTRNQKA